MHELNAQAILARVMKWEEEELQEEIRYLSQFAMFKYDQYERYSPGRHFIESLALWLSQMSLDDRADAYKFVKDRLIYVSNTEMAHLVRMVIPDIVDIFLQEHTAKGLGIPPHYVGTVCASKEYKQAKQRSLFLGMSDGSRTHELRRFNPDIKNDQVYHAYDSSDEKYDRMLDDHRKAVGDPNLYFEHLWLLDDFSGSGLSYIREEDGEYKGKLSRIMKSLGDPDEGELHPIFAKNFTIHIVIYVLTEQAEQQIRDHVEKLAEKYDLPAPTITCVMKLQSDVKVGAHNPDDAPYAALANHPDYYDRNAANRHTSVGGNAPVRFGFGDCGLPLVLEHNTPNNSLYILWGGLGYRFHGLFPRVDRHS